MGRRTRWLALCAAGIILRARCGAIVNATPVARNRERLPVNLAELDPGALVVDLVYNRMNETAFAEQARAIGHQVVDGRLVLLAQTGGNTI
jgi:shikimate 5-dehydrogenase